MSYLFLQLVTFALSISFNNALIEDWYCGKENCYDVLGIDRLANKSDLAKAYRKLARKYHPDMHKGVEEKLEAEQRFRLIATAYETLKEDDSRNDYDYLLDNPEEVYRHYYRYYRRKISPKVDVRVVIAGLVVAFSLVQYYVAKNRYSTAIKYLSTVPKYRIKALDYAKANGLLNLPEKAARRKNKEEAKELVEATITQVLENQMDIKGSFSKPKITDLYVVRVFLVPVFIWEYVAWYATWIWKFDVKGRPYGREEKLYIIRRNMKLSSSQFDKYSDSEMEEFLRMELHLDKNFKKWKADQEEKLKKEKAENGRVKAYRRYVKNHGLPRMTFDD